MFVDGPVEGILVSDGSQLWRCECWMRELRCTRQIDQRQMEMVGVMGRTGGERCAGLRLLSIISFVERVKGKLLSDVDVGVERSLGL